VLNDFVSYLQVYTTSRETIRTYVKGVRRFLAYCDSNGLSPDPTALRRFIAHLNANGASDSTIATYFFAAKSYLEYLGHDVSSLKPPRVTKKRIEDVPSIEDINKLIDRIPELRDKVLIAVGYDIGARVSELQHIRVKDVNIEEGIVRVGRVKKRSQGEPTDWGNVIYHWVPLRRITIPILAEYMEYVEGTWLFPGKGNKPIHVNTIRYICYKWTEEILGKRYGPHKLFRHARGTHLAQAGVSPFMIRDLLGHSNVSTTDAYVRQLTPEELRATLPPEVL